MEDVAHFRPLIALLLYFVAVSVLIIPLMVWLINRIATNQLYHINTRILLIIHCVGIIVHCADRFVLHGSDLYRWFVILPNSSACDIVSSAERCFSLRLFLNIGIFLSVCTTPTLVIERWIATSRVATYQNNRNAWVYLLGFQIFLTTGSLILLYSDTKLGEPKVYCIASNSDSPFYTLIVFSLTSVVQTLSILGFRYIMYKNKKLKKRLHETGSDLTRRYQVEESLRSLKTISLALHIMYLFQLAHSLSSFLVLNFNQYFSRDWYYFCIEITAFLPEYAIVFVITFLMQQKLIEKAEAVSLKKNIQVHPEMYFDQYKTQWTT